MTQLAFEFHHSAAVMIDGNTTLTAICDAVDRYRKLRDERLLEWAARASILRPQIMNAFMQAGGVIWGERRRCVWGDRQLFAELDGVTGGDVWRPDYHPPEFLPVMRWVEAWRFKQECLEAHHDH